MTKRTFPAILAGLLALILLCTGCGKVTAFLDQKFPEATTTAPGPISPEDTMPDRVGRTYVILLTTQLASADSLSHVSLLTFHTADESVHWLQLPAALYIRTDGNTLAGCYQSAYRAELGREGATSTSASAAAVAALRRLLSTGLSLPIDFSINLDPQQFTDFVTTLGDIPLHLSQSMGGLEAGDHQLNAAEAVAFLQYAGYKDAAEGQYGARRQFAAALWERAVRVITKDKLSLYTMELRGELTTDLPAEGGQDMFFLRRFITAKAEQFRITNVSTQNVYAAGTRCRVLIKDNTLRQLNSQMKVYQEDLEAPQFDSSGLFADFSDPIMQTVYTSSTVLPSLYTFKELLTVEPPATQTEDSPATEPVTGE